ncbi:hypothetical protein DH09_10095 [Bacillaceae bacterium JMAK1]|nr:hypothetical protein DH09_10095 [Bacillaceae bacterium JMAK1]
MNRREKLKVARKKRPNVSQPVEPVYVTEVIEIDENGKQEKTIQRHSTTKKQPKFEELHERKMIYFSIENLESLNEEKQLTRKSISKLVNEILDKHFE